MEALILSCGTGGGHDAAAAAIAQALHAAGHGYDRLNPYTLLGSGVAKRIDQTYIKTVQYAPKVFGVVYWLGELYERVSSKKSPVYRMNYAHRHALQAYLQAHNYDVIIITHVFPGELLTALQADGQQLPPIIYCTTDYTCAPFTAEVKADAYIIAHRDLLAEFQRHGLAATQLYPFGIPVQAAFQQPKSSLQAKIALGLDVTHEYWLVACGSLGMGNLHAVLKNVVALIQNYPNKQLIIITGQQKRVQAQLKQRYGQNPQVQLLAHTTRMAEYLQACECYLTKPGGLSSTEAIVAQIPLIHLQPLPGVEPKNQQFFVEHGLSFKAETFEQLQAAITQVQNPQVRLQMVNKQAVHATPEAATAIVALAQQFVAAKMR
ncbi:MAG: MGDG synthase family glycosyltransferase [Culicoidibacterales bacterium]